MRAHDKTRQHVSLRITGQVQGVFYRTSAQHVAQGLGITGYARNNPDGSVTIEAEGTPDAIAELIRWCKVGPRRAQVVHIEVEPGGLQHYTSFETY